MREEQQTSEAVDSGILAGGFMRNDGAFSRALQAGLATKSIGHTSSDFCLGNKTVYFLVMWMKWKGGCWWGRFMRGRSSLKLSSHRPYKRY